MSSGGPEGWIGTLADDLRPTAGSHSYLGRLPDGKQVVVRRVPVGSSDEADRMLEYLHRLAAYANPFLVPIRGAEYRDRALWVMSDFDDGVSLADLMARSRLSTSDVVAIGISVLSGLAALQQVGLSHGRLSAGNVSVSRDGRVRLAGYALQPRFRPGSSRIGWPDPRADLVACGRLLCSALGVPLERTGPELSDAERSAPALAAALRVMAEGRSGRYAGSALGLFEEASGTRARPVNLERTRRELGSLVRGNERGFAPSTSDAVAGAEEETATPPRAAVPGSARAGAGALSGAMPGAAVATAAAPGGAASRPGPPSAAGPGATRAAGQPGAGRPRWLLALAAALGVLLVLLAVWGVASIAGTRRAAVARTVPTASALPAVAAAPPSTNPGSEAPAASPPVQEAPAPMTPPAASADQGEPAPAAAAGADSPTSAVARFYDYVVAHDFPNAVQLWTPGMQAAYPPGENVYSRFSNTTAMTLQRDQLVSSGDGSAVVSIDVMEVRGGQTYHWVGNWYLVHGSSGWLLDRPALRPA